MSQDPLSAAAGVPPGRLRRFASSLRELGSTRDVDDALQLSVDLAAELVPGIDFADIMFVRGRQVTTPVSTHEVAIAVDQAQQESGEGPCLTALRDAELVVCHDLQEDDRWPRFSPRGLELGVRSVVAHRMFLERNSDHHLGAMNMFGKKPGLDDLSIELGGVFAAHCSTVLAAAVSEEGLQTALRTRDVIGQAKGILMERHWLTADQAYTMLRRASNQHNIKIRDLAEQVSKTGVLP